MKRIRILPLSHAAKTEVSVPGSKSYTLRALLLAALTKGTVKIINPLVSDDTEAMVACLKKLGIKVADKPGYIEVIGDISDVKDDNYDLDAGLSGITLRFMLALSSIIPGQQTLHGQAGLNKRPIGDMVESLTQLGADIEYLGNKGYPPLLVKSSKLAAGTVKLAGTESSQYLSALLMIAPLVGSLTIEITGELVSKPYVDMTIDAMKHFGVSVGGENYKKYIIAGDQSYNAAEYKVEGDISSAGYFFAIAALTKSTITVTGINPESLQADMSFLKILEQMGGKVIRGKDSITVSGTGVRPLSVDMRDCPDQAQTLAVLAAFADGETTISGIKSLRVKETERVAALEQELRKMGIKTSSTTDTLVVQGGKPKSASIETYGDHRMAMSFAVAGTKLAGMEIQDPGVVSKTFPDFWEKLAAIGVKSELVLPNIVLIGMRGSGKTTVAGLLARKLHIEQLDLDEVMAKKLALSTPEIVQKHGWGYFRDQESAIAEDISSMNNTLISTGGGIVLKTQNVAALKKNGVLILLRASVDVLISRLDDARDRPALTDAKSPRAEIRQVFSERQRLYETAADIIVDTDNLQPKQVADHIIAKLKGGSV